MLPAKGMLILQHQIVYSLAFFMVSCGTQSWPVLFQVALEPTLKHLCRKFPNMHCQGSGQANSSGLNTKRQTSRISKATKQTKAKS